VLLPPNLYGLEIRLPKGHSQTDVGVARILASHHVDHMVSVGPFLSYYHTYSIPKVCSHVKRFCCIFATCREKTTIYRTVLGGFSLGGNVSVALHFQSRPKTRKPGRQERFAKLKC
jgi:hypothetical protein